MTVPAKNWDTDGVPYKQSNVANIGTEEDKAQRKEAAKLEKEWELAGLSEGIQVWRIENFEVVPWPKEGHGRFHEGDSYIILHTTELSKGCFDYKIFFWLGQATTTDEMGTAAYKTVELDDYFDGAASQSREVQARESAQFRALFPTITYLKGGMASGFHHVEADAFEPKLYRIRKTSQGVVSQEVTVSKESLNNGDCFVLDTDALVYIWTGDACSPMEAYEAGVFAEQLESQHGGRAKATRELDEQFWALLGEGRILDAEEASDRLSPPPVGEGVLYKVVEGDDVDEQRAHVEEVGRGDVKKEMLDSSCVMIFDVESEVFVWVGQGATTAARRNAQHVVSAFLRQNSRDVRIPTHVHKEGSSITNPLFTKAFAN